MYKLSVIFVIFLASAVVIGQQCGPNQVWDDCGTACEDYCNKVQDPNEICTTQCIAGCLCAPNHKKRAIDSDTCVTQDNCPAPCPGQNMIYKECGSMCPAYCGQPDDIVCPAVCVEGCFCKDGYVLANENSSVCIPAHHCPNP